MTKTKMIMIAVGIIMLATNVVAEDITPDEIFEKVKAAYESMQTYQSNGVIISEIDAGGRQMNTETTFSILLKKPNLYLISWTQKNRSMLDMVQSGAVWSDGSQPYLYMGMINAYSAIESDEMALGGATGISGGATLTVPALFFACVC